MERMNTDKRCGLWSVDRGLRAKRGGNMCYTVPVIGTMVTSFIWIKTKSKRIMILNLMLLGAALFGVIDHAWNNELFLISDHFLSDILLGVTITFVTVLVWAIGIWVQSRNSFHTIATQITRNGSALKIFF